MTTLNLQVSASSDDANETGAGAVQLTNATITLTSTSAWLGFRFLNVTIPRGSTIASATLQVYAHSTANDDPAFDIYAQADDNPATFTTAANDISSRSRTTAVVNWTETNTGTGFQAAPDLRTVMQEIVDRPGWASGNALVLLLDAVVGISFTARMFDNAAVDAATLDIEYTSSVSASSGPSFASIGSRYRSQQISILVEDPIYFTQRGYSERLTSQIESYNHELRAIGGYWSSSFNIKDRQSNIEDWIDYGLGRHIVTYNPGLDVIWEGFVNRISATLGPFAFEIGPLLSIGNRITMTYTPVDTTIYPPIVGSRTSLAVANNTDSQALYGIIHKIYSANQLSTTEATQQRDMLINDPTRAWPNTSRKLNLGSSGEPSVQVECLGYWNWLKTYFYTSTTTGTTQIRAKIQNVLTAQLNTIFSADYSQISANSTAVLASGNGERTAEDIIKDLVSRGDNLNSPYSCGFYEGRRLHYQAVPTSYEYQQRIAGNLGIIDLTENEIKPWDVKPNKYIFFPDFLVGRFPPVTTLSLGSDPRIGYIEVANFSAPYNVSTDGNKLSQVDQLLARRAGI